MPTKKKGEKKFGVSFSIFLNNKNQCKRNGLPEKKRREYEFSSVFFIIERSFFLSINTVGSTPKKSKKK